MAAFAAVVVAAFFLENDDLVATQLFDDFGHDAGAAHGGRADFSFFAADHQHFIERDCIADIAAERDQDARHEFKAAYG